ncbi:MAG: hypothetical protein OEW58_07895 [Gammaproteobacteria bacterium]|nr:hypothetical protein [Gammaproteobacteria bacterium]
MKNSSKKSPIRLIAALLVLLILAISSPLIASTPGPVLELQFSGEVVNPEDSNFMDELSSYVGAPLHYMRPASGGEHLLQLAKPLPNGQMSKLVARLKKHHHVTQVRIFF